MKTIACLVALVMPACSWPRTFSLSYGDGERTVSATATWDPPTGKRVVRSK